jgi:hypothetical protein
VMLSYYLSRLGRFLGTDEAKSPPDEIV